MKTPLINLQGWTRTVKTIAGKHNLRVRFDNHTDTMSIKGNTVTIPTPDNRWTQKDYDNVLYYVDQYGSMWRYGPDAFKEFQELPSDKPIGWMLREFEQHRTMRQAGEEFKGSQEIMSTGVGNRMQDVVIPQVDKMDTKLQAIMQQAAEASAHHNRGYASSVGELMKHVLKNDDGAELLDKLDDMEFHDALNGVETTKDSLDLAKRVFEQIWEENADEQEQKERGEGEGDGEGEDGEGGGQGLEGTNPNSATGMTDGEGSGKESEAGAKGKTTDPSKAPPPEGDGSCYVITSPKGRSFTLEDPNTIKHYDLKANPEAKPNRGKIKAWMGYEDGGDANAAMFANRLRREIMVQSQAFYTHGHRRGRISTKNLWKLAIDHEVAGEDRMFKQKHDSDILDTAVEVLVDYSGSMAGSETVLTYEGTRLLVHAMQVLNVPCEVNMFSTVTRGTDIITVKHFDERINDETLLDRSERAAHQMSGNNDSGAVLWTYDRIKRRPEKRKLYLVLSDGQPAAHNVENPEEALQHVVKGIEQEGLVEIMGLGVGPYASVQYYYTQHVSVNDITQMPTALVDLIGNKMLSEAERS